MADDSVRAALKGVGSSLHSFEKTPMKLPSWIKRLYSRKPARPPSLTDCPKCGREMDMIDKSTMSGDDMRTYRCGHCQEEHIVNYGVALWKVLSDARNSDVGTS